MSYLRPVWVIATFSIFFPQLLPADVSDLEENVEKYLKKIEKIYPLEKWEKDIGNFKKDLHKNKKEFYSNPGRGVDNIPYKKLKIWSSELKDFKKYKKPIQQVMGQLASEAIISENFPKTMRVKSVEEARARSQLLVSIKMGEKKRLGPKKILLSSIDNLQKEFDEFQADWMFNFARKSLFKSVRLKFETFHYTENGTAFQAYTRLFRNHLKGMEKDPELAGNNLQSLLGKLHSPMKDLNDLEASLTPNMIYASILESAAQNNIDFTIKAEEKIESILQLLSDQNTKAVKLRRGRWERFQMDIQTSMDFAVEIKQKQEERLARKKEMQAHVSALTSGSGNVLDIDPDIDQAMKIKTKKVKTSTISSGRKKLDVQVDSFSDTLAHVSDLSFTVENKSSKFEQIYGDVRENTGLYVFVADGNRADKKDLKDFINEVGLLSFGSSREFLSYQLPEKWKPSSSVRWETLKEEPDTSSFKREFSYVELFTEAHRKGQKKYQMEQEQIEYTPANTIIIFNAQGKVLRYQVFTNIRALKIHKSDLVQGTLYYKFLNYSTRGKEIYLNGIDHEIKTAKPS